MAEHVLMEKGPATMNVPPDKVEEYMADGWTVVTRPPVTTLLPKAEDVTASAEVPTAESIIKKQTRKSSAKSSEE